MSYLIAKFALLFLFTAALAFMLGYWWARRNFVDVSESYADLRKAAEQSDAFQWEMLWQRLDAMPEPKETDLSDVVSRLDGVATAVSQIPEPQPVKLTSTEARLDELTAAVRSIPVPMRNHDVDLVPVEQGLARIETELRDLGLRITDLTANDTAQPKSATTQGQPKILSAALHGDKDDLKRISGVGPKLEQLLNENGVYYYWQVASWSGRDIEVIDERLDVFKGRIVRDNWVSQAQNLKAARGAARMPGDS